MNEAIIISVPYNEELHSAEWVKKNIIRPNDLYYMDLSRTYRVQFVSAAKNNGGPYFRLYLTLKDWSREHPGEAIEKYYEIVSKLEHYGESEWHKKWENNFKTSQYGNAITEKYFKNEAGEKRRADIFIPERNTVVEVEHSFEERLFSEKTKFYDKEGMNLIWLFDLTQIPVHDDSFSREIKWIPEDNSFSFFRIAEEYSNLENYPMFVQLMDGYIYMIKKLERADAKNGPKGTMRWFYPSMRLSEDEFIKAVFHSNEVKMFSLEVLIRSSRLKEYYDSRNKEKQFIDKLFEEKRKEEQQERESQKKELERAEQIRLQKERIEREKLESGPDIKRQDKVEEVGREARINSNKSNSLDDQRESVVNPIKEEDQPSGHYNLQNWEWDRLLSYFSDPTHSVVYDFHGKRYLKCRECGEIGQQDEFDTILNGKIGVHKPVFCKKRKEIESEQLKMDFLKP